MLASTDFSPYQSEEATLVACPECTSKQVKLSAQPKYMHWGEITDCVDERGEVGLLTRNILIRGEVESECYGMPECAYIPGNIDLFGGHFKVMMGFANAHIEGVEFYKMGQQLLGRYDLVILILVSNVSIVTQCISICAVTSMKSEVILNQLTLKNVRFTAHYQDALQCTSKYFVFL